MIRRFRTKRQGIDRIPTHKLICFQLGSDRYAIPIDRVQRVLNEFTSHGVLQSDRSLVEYNNELITIINASKFFVSSNDDREDRYLIVCTLKKGERFGIPVPQIPTVLEVAEDKLIEVPKLYKQRDLSPAIQKIIRISDSKIVFYLDLEKLVNTTG